jgi:hypothetical protein
MEEEMNAFNILVGKFEKIALRKPRRRREDNIKIGLKEMGCKIMD